MRILLLGATGQIGGALATALAHTEHELSVLVRSASALNLPSDVTVVERPQFTRDAFAAALRDVDHAVYCLGPPEQFLFDDSEFERAHCRLLEIFLEAMCASAVRRLTYVSTYEVFSPIDGVVDETHPISDGTRLSAYSQSKIRAYRRTVDVARANGIQLTTIHPAAVFGGLNTGRGVTDYMSNLASWKWYRVPFINAGSFPVIHVDSLADLVIRALDKPGAYIASDQMTSLRDIADTMRLQQRSYVPMVMPLGLVKLGARIMEAAARVLPVIPLTSTVQIAFLTRGWRPSAHKAVRDLGWKPMTLAAGIERFLATGSSRATPAAGAVAVQDPAAGVSLPLR